MSDEVRKYLFDMLEAINRIEDHIGNPKKFENYISNRLLKDSVERNIITIGEAMNQALKINPDLLVSFSKQIVGARNKLVHGYDEIEDDIIWKIVINYLPQLKSEIEKQLAD